MYVYVQSESNLWSVGHYTPGGRWLLESEHDTAEMAARRVAWLNGSGSAPPPDHLEAHLLLLDEAEPPPPNRIY